MLFTIPGIGIILGLAIMLEVAQIERFPKGGNYASYCRCIGCKRLSNGFADLWTGTNLFKIVDLASRP